MDDSQHGQQDDLQRVAAPERLSMGCAGWFQLLLWTAMGGYLVQRLIQQERWLFLVVALLVLTAAIYAQVRIYRRRKTSANYTDLR